jgi:hypothetical protein
MKNLAEKKFGGKIGDDSNCFQGPMLYVCMITLSIFETYVSVLSYVCPIMYLSKSVLLTAGTYHFVR